MRLSSSLHSIAEVVEGIESVEGGDIEVSARRGDLVDDGQVSVDLDLRVPLPEVDADDVEVTVRETGVRESDELAVTLAVESAGENGAADSETERDERADAGPERPTEPDDDPGSTVEAGEPDDSESVGEAGDADAAPEADTRAEGRGSDDPRRNHDLPPYRDPDALRDVYERCDTFAEMRDALETDVTPQTVRKYMIEHGIHEPTSTRSSQLADASPSEIVAARGTDGSDAGTGDESDDADRETDGREDGADAHDAASPGGASEETTGTDDDGDDSATESDPEPNGTESDDADSDEADSDAPADESDPEGASDRDVRTEELDEETLVADGLDLPDHMTLADLKEAIRTSRTFFEIQQEMGVERERARRVLRELNLLELVHGRVAAKGDRPTVEEIDERIRTASLRAQ